MSEPILLPTTAGKQQGFIESFYVAYGKLTKNPFALTLFFLILVSIIALSNGQEGPFELIAKTLKEYIADKDHPKIIVSIASLLLTILNVIIIFENRIILVLAVIIIPMTYDDFDSPITLGLLTIYVLVSKHSLITLFLIIQLLFVYYSMYGAFNKIVLFVIIMVITLGTENFAKMLTVAEKKTKEVKQETTTTPTV